MPAVSVLMAVHNGERHLHAAIDSILAQTLRDFEFIVVDDGSTDRSRAIVEGYRDPRIRLIALERNAGLSAALNLGLQATESPLVARQDADDLSEPRRLERQLSVMHDRQELVLLGSQAVAITEDGTEAGTVWRPVEPVSIQWYSLFDNPFAHTSMMFRTAVVRDEFGGFDARYDPFSQDYALWCRVMERHDVANLADRLVRYRVHPSSIIGSLDQKDDVDEYRKRFGGIVREIIGGHASRMMIPTAVSDHESWLLASFVLGLEPSSLDAFLALVERLFGTFLERHPGAFERPDFRRTLARQFDTLALRVSPSTRGATWRVYSHAIRRHPQLVRHVAWTRALALLFLGKHRRDHIATWGRARRLV